MTISNLNWRGMRYEDVDARAMAGRQYMMQHRSSILRPKKLPGLPELAYKRALWRNNDALSSLSDTSSDKDPFSPRGQPDPRHRDAMTRNKKHKTDNSRVQYSPQLGTCLPSIAGNGGDLTKRRLQTCNAILDFCRQNDGRVVKDDAYSLLSQIQNALQQETITTDKKTKNGKKDMISHSENCSGKDDSFEKQCNSDNSNNVDYILPKANLLPVLVPKPLSQHPAIRKRKLPRNSRIQDPQNGISEDSRRASFDVVDTDKSLRITVRLPKVERTGTEYSNSENTPVSRVENIDSREMTPLPPLV